MKILFVRPPVPKQTLGLKNIMVCEPLGLEYAAAAIGDEHEVMIFDSLVEKRFEKRLASFKPDIVASNCYITGVNEVIKVSRKAKLLNNKCFTIAGGVHATKCPEDFADPAIDVIVMGDGTRMMPKIIKALENNTPLEKLPGLAIPTGPDEVYKTSAIPPIENIDQLPFPRRDLVDHLKHKYYYIFHQPMATMKTTWGCWYKCNFCFTWTITEGQVFSRSPESIADELEQIEQEDVYIVDDIFLINPKRLRRLKALLIERNIKKKFLVYGRADFIAQHEDIIKEWAEIGLSAVLIGLEASTNSELDSMDKQSSVDYNREAIAVLTRNGVDTYGSLIPHPDYTQKEWQRLFDFIEETGLYYLNVSPLTPLPGTPVFESWQDKITVPRKAHGLWDLSHVLVPTKVTLKEFYKGLLWLYAKSCIDLKRAKKLSLRKRPPWYSKKYFRLYTGVFRSYWQLRNAHLDHSEKSIKEAMDRGPEVPGLTYKKIDLQVKVKSHDRQAEVA